VLMTKDVPLEVSGDIHFVPYELIHFEQLIVRPHESNIKDAVKLSDTEWAKAIGKEAVEAYTAYIGDTIIGIGGLNLLWPTVGEVWIVGSPHIPKARFSYMRATKFYLKYFKEKYKLKRVQAQVVEGYDMLTRFVESLGFEYEGTLHNYCGGNLHNRMYAIWDKE